MQLSYCDLQGHDTIIIVLQGAIKVLQEYCAPMFLKMTPSVLPRNVAI
jgi:hypothetical protein